MYTEGATPITQSSKRITGARETAMLTLTKTTSSRPEPNGEGNSRRLLEDYLPLVRSVVYRMRWKLPETIEAEELHSVGLSGLAAAVQKYDPSRGETFAGYAVTRIRGAILDELRRQDTISRRSRVQAKRLERAISKLTQEQGASYSQVSLCAEMSLSEEELAGLTEEIRPVRLVSLDDIGAQPNCSDDSSQDGFGDDSLHEIIPDDSCVSALDALERKEIISLLAEHLAQLSDLQRKVLVMYYYQNMQLSEIAVNFGLTESRISQIRGQAVALLRKDLTKLLA
jgi:RNA polymerase sigma factor FliA